MTWNAALASRPVRSFPTWKGGNSGFPRACRACGGRPPLYDRAVPIYEFECEECGERFESLVDAGTEAAECPNCGAAGAQRRLSSFGLSRQPTANQRRRMEDKRGTNRDGARTRWKDGMAKRRGKPGA